MALPIIKNFRKYEQKIFEYAESRIDSYSGSECKKKLKNRVSRMNNSLDMRFNNRRGRSSPKNSWLSKVAFPLCRESYANLSATLKANFRGNPMFSAKALGESIAANARILQTTLSLNLKSTKFRSTTFNRNRRYAARYGCCVYHTGFGTTPIEELRTIETQLGIQQVPSELRRNNAINTAIHVLNYFQNPNIADPEKADYRGYTSRDYVSELIADSRRSQFYIKDNLEHIIKKAKKSSVEYSNYYEGKGVDYKSHMVDRHYWWGTLNIVDNEEDETVYYMEMVGDKIIRIQTHEAERNFIPLTVCTLEQRLEWWWGNTAVENVLPHENYMNLILSLTADDAIKATENIVFYESGSIDVADLNARAQNGGYVPMDLQGKSARDMFYNYQRLPMNMNGTQYIMSEVKESAQRGSIKSDLSRQGLPGGPRNKTLGAAQILEEEGNLVQSDFLTEFADGHILLAEKNAAILQEQMPDEFFIRENERQGQQLIYKGQILGDFGFEMESSLTKNKQSEALRLQNAITMLLNAKGSGNPDVQNTGQVLVKAMREWVRKLDLPGVDLDEDMPEQQQAALNQIPLQQAVA